MLELECRGHTHDSPGLTPWHDGLTPRIRGRRIVDSVSTAAAGNHMSTYCWMSTRFRPPVSLSYAAIASLPTRSLLRVAAPSQCAAGRRAGVLAARSAVRCPRGAEGAQFPLEVVACYRRSQHCEQPRGITLGQPPADACYLSLSSGRFQLSLHSPSSSSSLCGISGRPMLRRYSRLVADELIRSMPYACPASVTHSLFHASLSQMPGASSRCGVLHRHSGPLLQCWPQQRRSLRRSQPVAADHSGQSDRSRKRRRHMRLGIPKASQRNRRRPGSTRKRQPSS